MQAPFFFSTLYLILNFPTINHITGTTSDGKSGPPSNVVAKCKFDNVSDMNFVEVEWAIPQKPNGLIEFYNVSA